MPKISFPKAAGKHAAGRAAASSAAGRHTSEALSDAAFIRQSKLAEAGIWTEKFGIYGPENMRSFWAATKPYWQGRSTREYYDAIKEGLGVDTLEEAYDKVVENWKKAKQASDEAAAAEGWTDAAIDYNEPIDETDGTPIEFFPVGKHEKAPKASTSNYVGRHEQEGSEMKDSEYSGKHAPHGAHERVGKHESSFKPQNPHYKPRH